MTLSEQRIRAGCDGKRRYAGPYTAHAALKRISKKREAGGKLEAYRCPHCQGWHLGQGLPR